METLPPALKLEVTILTQTRSGLASSPGVAVAHRIS